MEKRVFTINGIPSIVWGKESKKIIIAIHGNMSNKADIPIELLANHAVEKEYQVLSFDLPKHGDRKEENTLCKVQECVEELTTIMQYVKKKWQHISVFGNSIGAYFSLVAYQEEEIQQAWFLSPVVDMQLVIENMMTWFNVSKEQLENEQTIETPIGQTLYWDYYCYVKENPIIHWQTPTFILYGEVDDMCPRKTIETFTKKFNGILEIVEGGEHYFHTTKQLQIFTNWLEKTI